MEMFNFSGASAVPSRSLLDFTPLSAPQKRHITKIYAALTVNVLLTALGVYVHLNWLRVPTVLPLILSVGCVLGLNFSSQKAHAESKMLTRDRALMFGGFGFLNGMLIANYLHAVHFYVGPRVVPAAFFASVAVFSCLSAAALLAKQRSYLYLGAILSSVLGYFMLASFVNIFWKTQLLTDILLWGGLFMYLGFVVYDTQLAVAQFDRGNRDYLVHALQFYVNFVSVFLRLVAILSDRQEESNRRKRDGRDH
ncbi:bax inhibitor 1 [Cyclospora cayetanensis]|uniref:BAX inhibitor related protein n=2 Tax=Cyclospora cayetanensis TaxID=88456 RepID=A0A1D3D4N7_9EIME|nr:bax inhibitor 1 [Cyclospora cayetanensis]OEH78411.1 BAX inhibitor related protein [Cyclospora cayetanensis]